MYCFVLFYYYFIIITHFSFFVSVLLIYLGSHSVRYVLVLCNSFTVMTWLYQAHHFLSSNPWNCNTNQFAYRTTSGEKGWYWCQPGDHVTTHVPSTWPAPSPHRPPKLDGNVWIGLLASSRCIVTMKTDCQH